jgi:hypothetical protein
MTAARPAIPEGAFVSDVRVRLFLTSFAVLFFELICIRWIPAHIRYIGYFSNFILLASFLGIGIGILLGRRSWWLPPFPFLLLVLVLVVAQNRIEVRLNSTDVLYYGAGEDIARTEHYLVLPVVIVLVALAFLPLARPLGALLSALPRLRAYTIDIFGSLAGIATFFLMAWLSLSPIVWFLVLGALLAVLASRRAILIGALPLVVVLGVVFSLQRDAEWSPYYKLTVTPAYHEEQEIGYVINVNNAGQQIAVPQEFKEPFYSRVYELFPPESFEQVLILGAGSGSDTSVALARGVGAVDAVEIDPKIMDLGRRLNPDRPYDDPRVETFVNDGRAFLRQTDRRYDLIVFALPDSLTLTSGFSNLRLESFLLTREALADARERLTENGLVILYNYYRFDWFIEKLAGMMEDVFGAPPFVSSYGGWGRAAVLMAGPRIKEIDPTLVRPYAEVPGRDPNVIDVIGEGFLDPGTPAAATDDWPFLYLQERTFPRVYAGSLLLLGVLAVVGVLIATPARTLRRFDWHMFFLGAAFILVETKSLVTFGLLFGSTWMVNSLVFFAILCSVLLAILVSSRLQIRNPWPLYALLLGTLLLNYAVRPETLLLDTPALRYVVAGALAFSPVFIANVVFSRSFRDSEEADVAFASNLLGIMAGGTLEYFALLWGYRALLLVALALYLAAAIIGEVMVGRLRLWPGRRV